MGAILSFIAANGVDYYPMPNKLKFRKTPMHLTPQVTDNGTIFSPQRHGEHRGNFIFARSGDGDRAKEVTLRARPSKRVVLCRGLETCHRAFAEGEGSFPWPSSPGQGKKSLSSVASVSLWLILDHVFLGHHNAEQST